MLTSFNAFVNPFFASLQILPVTTRLGKTEFVTTNVFFTDLLMLLMTRYVFTLPVDNINTESGKLTLVPPAVKDYKLGVVVITFLSLLYLSVFLSP